VRIGAAGDYWNDLCNAEFCAFFDRPFHTIEFEDGKEQREICGRGSGDFFGEVEFDTMFSDIRDASAAGDAIGNDVEFLADTGAQDAGQMIGMGAGERGVIFGEFVGDPAAAGHR
jgi:hypothetical protein